MLSYSTPMAQRPRPSRTQRTVDESVVISPVTGVAKRSSTLAPTRRETGEMTSIPSSLISSLRAWTSLPRSSITTGVM